MSRDLALRVEPHFGRSLPAVQNDASLLTLDPRLTDFFNLSVTSAGTQVSEQSAMRVSAAYACVDLISACVASMPVDVFRRKPDAVEEKINTGDPLWWILNEEPSPRWTAYQMWKWSLKAKLLRGDAFIRIIRNRNGQVLGLEPVAQAWVDVRLIKGRLAYFWTDETGQALALDQDDVLHIPGFGFNGLRGMSAIQWGARNGIGIGLATDEFSSRFFGAGMMTKHVIKAPGRMNQERTDELRAAFEEKYGGLGNSWRPMILTEGLDIKELSLSAIDSQLLEARKFQVIDIARAFRVPPIMIGATETASSWGTGVEQITLGFVKYTLGDHLKAIEQECNRKLFRTAARFLKFDVNELLRGDSAARTKRLRDLVGGSQGPGIMTQNEARRSEGLAPIEGGDALYDPKNSAAPAADPGNPATPDPATPDPASEPTP